MKIMEYIKKVPKEVSYTIYLFLATRAVLTVIGISSSAIFGRFLGFKNYISLQMLNVWGGWDGVWYLNIAQNGYSTYIDQAGQANYGFFPLYPIFIKIFSFIFQNYFVSALIVSNLFLILSGILLYKLVRLDSDEKTSLRAIKYLFLFPGAFVLSMTLSESTFLFFLIACFYLAKKQKWLLCGLSGILLNLTKPFGVIIIIPMLYEYFKSLKKNKENSLKKNILNFICVIISPLGLAMFSFYTFLLTGDFLAYPHIKQTGWQNYFESPIKNLSSGLTSGFSRIEMACWAAIIIIAMFVFFYKKIGFSYFLTGMLLILFSICYQETIISGFRYDTVIFPIYILLAKITEWENTDNAISSFLSMLQGYLMVFWQI